VGRRPQGSAESGQREDRPASHASPPPPTEREEDVRERERERERGRGKRLPDLGKREEEEPTHP
jgi:hypothetical protein